MKYKGYTITHNSNFVARSKKGWTNYDEGWIISNEAGKLQQCGTLNECKEWINENPIEDFVAITIFGEIPCDKYWDKGVSSLVDFLKNEGTCDGYITRRVFKTKAECEAYSQGVADMCGCNDQTPITEKEYQQIMKKIC